MGLKLTLLQVAQLRDNCVAYYGLAFPSSGNGYFKALYSLKNRNFNWKKS